MTRAALVMACVSATAAVAGTTIFALPSRSEAAVYGKRIAGTMFCALALTLALFAWGLERMATS
jgi:dolichol kinase